MANEISVQGPALLVAVRDRREQVIAVLTESFAQDLFDIDEFDRRIDLAHRATSLAELDELVKDLAAPATSTAVVPRPSPETLATWPEKRALRAILGGFDKRGRFSVARRTNVTCFWGGRDARLARGSVRTWRDRAARHDDHGWARCHRAAVARGRM